MLHVKPEKQVVGNASKTYSDYQTVKVSAAPDTLKEYFLTPLLSLMFSKFGEVKKYQCKERILLMTGKIVLGKIKAVVCKILN